MKIIGISGLLLLSAGLTCFAQSWELGGGAGFSFAPGVNVSNPAGSATAGFKPGASFAAFAGQNIAAHLGGEIRYEFIMGDQRLKSGGSEATFSNMSHAVHYDILLHTNKKGARAQLFVAVGGGMKVFQGTGKELPFQPLSQFGYMTKTRVVKPMGDFGAGVKYKLAERVVFRTEFRDFITPFPENLIAPAPGSKFGSILHNFVPMVSIAYEY